MHKRTLLFFFNFAFIYVNTYAQQSTKQLSYAQWWSKIELASSHETPFVSDTMLVMQTTRQLINSEKGKTFFDHTTALNSKQTTLLAVCKNEHWKIFIMPDINAAMLLMPLKKDLVVYIEGLGKNFPIAMYRAAGLTTQYDVNVIMFDYPTLNESQGLIKNFYFAENSSKKTAGAFSSFLKTLQGYETVNAAWISNKNKTLFIHSLGNVMLKEAMVQNLLNGLQPMLFNRLVLNAACIKQKKHYQWIDSIRFAAEKFIHYNKKDLQLVGARFLKRQLMLGALPKKTLSKQAYYVDFMNILGRQHNGYLNNPGVSYVPLNSSKYYYSLLHGEKISFGDTSFFEKGKLKTTHSYSLKKNTSN